MHGQPGVVGPAGQHGVEDAHVLGAGGLQPPGGVHHVAAEGRQPLAHAAQLLHQHRVAAGGVQGVVEVGVGRRVGHAVVGRCCCGGALLRLLQRGTRRATDALRGQPRAHGLQLGQALQQRHQFGRGRAPHTDAGARQDLHQPLLGQQDQRLAHRRARHPVRGHQRRVVDRVARRQPAFQDVGLHRLPEQLGAAGGHGFPTA